MNKMQRIAKDADQVLRHEDYKTNESIAYNIEALINAEDLEYYEHDTYAWESLIKMIDNNYSVDALAQRLTARISRIIESEAIDTNAKGYGVKRRINKLRAFRATLIR